MPQTRPGRRGDAADRLDRAPYRAAGRFDAWAGSVIVGAPPGLGDAQMRQIERAQRIELRYRKARPEILPSLAHAGADRAAPLHDHQRVDRAIGPAGMAGSIGNRPLELLNPPLPQAFRGRTRFCRCRRVELACWVLWHSYLSNKS